MMKRFTLILSVLIALSIKASAQIPNSGFENWTPIVNCSEPTGWHSLYYLIGSNSNNCPVSSASDPYPLGFGSYSARIANDTAVWNTGIGPGNMVGWGLLTSTENGDRPLFLVTGHPVALCGYYKFLPANDDTMNIGLHLYLNGSEITNANFQSSAAAPDWTPFSVMVNDPAYLDVDSARIMISSANEPRNGHGGPRGNSVLYIDNLTFDNLITSVPQEAVKNSFSLFPNPASNSITVESELKMDNGQLKIINAQGQLIHQSSINDQQSSIDVGDLSNGIYIVEVTTNEGTAKQKLVIQK